MDNKHNPQILIDSDLILAEGVYSANYFGDKKWFRPDDAFYLASTNLYFGLVNAKIEIDAIKKTAGNETYLVQILVDNEAGDDILVAEINVPRTILDTHQKGYTYFLPFVLDAKTIHCEISVGGTLPSISCKVSVVKELTI